MISTLSLKKYISILILFILSIALPIEAETNNKNLVNIYFFHSEDCSHCKVETKLLDSLEDKYDNIKIYRYEIHENINNENRLKVQELYNIKSNGVPLTIIGDTPYIGYHHEKSPIKFIKTIEYYSRYGYHDRVGELLKIETLSKYKDESAPKLDNFLEEYGNYKLIGTLSTNDLDLSTTSLILGILSQLNILKIITNIIVILLAVKLKDITKKTYLLFECLTISIIFNPTNLISNHIYIASIYIILIILLILGIIKYIKTSNKYYKYHSILIILLTIGNYLENYFYAYPKILKDLIILNNITGINKINYYGNYLFIIFIINIIFVLIFYKINNKIFNKKVS